MFDLPPAERMPVELPGLHENFPSFLQDVTKYIGHLPDFLGDSVRLQMAEESTAFHHSVGTLTTEVSMALHHMATGAPVIGITYQPNMFPSYRVLAQVLTAQRVQDNLAARGTRPVIVFRMLDYDAAGDKGFRSASFPSPTSDAAAALSGAVPRRLHDRVAMAVPSPDAPTVSRWVETFRRSSVEWARWFNRNGVLPEVISPRRTSDLAGEIGDVIIDAYARHPRFTTANSAVISNLVNKYWGLDVVFLSASSLLGRKSMGVTLIELWRNARRAGIEHKDLGMWRICDACFRRNPTDVSFDDGIGEATMKSTCCSGGREERFDLGTKIRLPDGGEVPRFVPRVGLCDLLDLAQLGYAGIVSYAGGAGHVRQARVDYPMVMRSQRFTRQNPELLYRPQRMFVTSSGESELARAVPPAAFTAFQAGRVPAALLSTWVEGGNLARMALAGPLETDSSSGIPPLWAHLERMKRFSESDRDR